VGKAAVAEEEPGMCNRITGKLLRDNVGKNPLAAGAGSNLQSFLERDQKSKQRKTRWGLAHELVVAMTEG